MTISDISSNTKIGIREDTRFPGRAGINDIKGGKASRETDSSFLYTNERAQLVFKEYYGLWISQRYHSARESLINRQAGGSHVFQYN